MFRIMVRVRVRVIVRVSIIYLSGLVFIVLRFVFLEYLFPFSHNVYELLDSDR